MIKNHKSFLFRAIFETVKHYHKKIERKKGQTA